MESFRKLIKGWLGKVLLVLFLIPLALVGIEGYFGGSNKGDVAKQVNGQPISNKELDELIKAYQQQYLQFVQGDESLLNTNAIRESALNTLIARTLLLQQADKLDVKMSDNQFVQMLSQLPDFQVNGKFSNEVFGNYLRSRGITKEMLTANLQQDHALKMLSGTVSNYALVSPMAIERFADLQTEQRELYLSSIKLDEYKKGINISNQEISAYYEKHKNDFRRNASVDVDYVIVKPEMIVPKTPFVVNENELQQAYTQYVEKQKSSVPKIVKHILITKDTRSEQDALKIANDIEAKIKAGLAFDAAAKQYSEDPSSKDKGGVIAGYQTGTLGSDEFDQAVNTLQNQTISQPVKTNFGYHIITVQSEPVKIESFENMKAELIKQLEKTQAVNLYTDTVNHLNDTMASNNALDVVTEQVKAAQIQRVDHVTLWTKDPYLSNAAVKAKLFNDSVKTGDHSISTSVQLADGSNIWVKVRNYHAEGPQTLEQAQNDVKVKLLNKKAADLAQAKIATTLAAFNTQPAAEVVAKGNIKFEKAGVYTRQNLKQDIAKVAFTLPTPKAGMWSVGAADLADELVIVAVASVKSDGFKSLSPEQVQQVKQAYQQSRSEQELADYVDYLKSNAKIK